MKNGILAVVLLICGMAGLASAQSTEGVRSIEADRSEISQLMVRWGFYRDHSRWEDLRSTFHPDGEIKVTWYIGDFEGFVDESIKMAEDGTDSNHFIKPSIIEVEGDRAIAITPVSITARAGRGSVQIDVTSNAYFYDFLEYRSNEWRVSRRIAVYQNDRMESVDPSITFNLFYSSLNLDQYNPAYKHLAAALSLKDFATLPGQVVDKTDESRALYDSGQRWLRDTDITLDSVTNLPSASLVAEVTGTS